MIKRILFPTLLALAATACFAKADVTIENKFEVGAKLNYKFEMKMVVSGMDVSLKASPLLTVKSVKEGVATVDHAFNDIKLMIGDSEQESKFDPIVVEKRTSGELVKVGGGLEQLSATELYMIMHFAPSPKAIAEKGEYKMDFTEKNGVPAYAFSGTYEGTEKVGGKDTFRFTTKLAVKGNGKLSSENKVWVTMDGTVVKLSAKFKNLDVPAAGGPQEGTISLTLAEK